MRDFFRDNLATMNDNYTNEYTQDLNVTQINTSQGNNVSYFQVVANPTLNKSTVIPGSKIFWSSDSGATYTDTTATAMGVAAVFGNSLVLFTDKVLDSTFMDPFTRIIINGIS